MHLRLEWGVDSSLPLNQGTYVIGRSGDAAIQIKDSLASREHAVVHVTPGGILVEDLGSRNGTLVNGRYIARPTELREGDWLRIGDHVFWVRGGDVQRSGSRVAPGWEFADTSDDGDTMPAPGSSLLLVVRDQPWADEVRRAACLHPDLQVSIVPYLEAATTVESVSRGLLLLDVSVASSPEGLSPGSNAEEILEAWRRRDGRGPVLVSSNLNDADGAVLAHRIGASGYVRAGKPAILVVAQVRFHLGRSKGGSL